MRIGILALVGACALAGVIGAGACGSDSTEQPPSGVPDAGNGEAGPRFTSVVVEPAEASVTVKLGGTASQNFRAFATINGQKTELTACAWSVADSAFGSMSGGTFNAAPHAGVTSVSAVCEGVAGTAKLNLDLRGEIVLPGAPANAAALFGAATAGTTAARVPVIEYPLDGAVAPRNIPPIEVQYTAAQNDLGHVTFSAPHLAIDVYVAARETQLELSAWRAITDSAAGQSLVVSVEGLQVAQPAQKFAAKPVTLRLSRDRLDETALYYWASSKSSLMTQTFGEVKAPTQVKGACTSCHSVARSGSRIGYSRCVNNDCNQLFAGFLRYDTATQAWVETMNADNKAVRASYTSFAPLGYPYADDAKAVAVLAKSDCTLGLYDPDSGQPLASNAGAASVKGPGAPRCATMPDWSPDGRTVVFASTPTQGQWIDVAQSRLATMGYTFNAGQHSFADAKLIVSSPITLPSGTYDNFFFPSWSADGKFVIFNAARGAWRNFTSARAPGQRMMLTDGAGAWTVDLANANGPGDLDITWPHWAPSPQGDYYWVVFASQRDYGHRLTSANSAASCIGNGVTQCKQIWVAAIDKAKLAGGTPVDPSAPPVWMPGQDIDADNISPYWTVPTSKIPR